MICPRDVFQCSVRYVLLWLSERTAVCCVKIKRLFIFYTTYVIIIIICTLGSIDPEG